MTLWRLVSREIRMRKFNFGLGVFSAAVAVGCFVAELTLLEAHDLRTRQLLAAKQAETEAAMARMEEDYRKITVKMGFNLLILPEGQELVDFYAEGFASKLMPEGYATKLAKSGIVSIQHLLPYVEQRIKWPEQKDRTIILAGVRGEVPILQGDRKQPILSAVPPGKVVVGYELAKTLGLKAGERVTLLGRQFAVHECHAERGTKDDITVWADLAQVQEMLNQRGKINAMMALECHCAGVNLGTIRQEVARILPGTQVIELTGKAVARAEARDTAAAVAKSAMESERKHRAELRRQREAIAGWLVPLVIAGCMIWVALLALTNVRERRVEIGILRAVGLGSRQVLLVFLARALVVGMGGAALGYLGGFGIGVAGGEVSAARETLMRLFHPGLVVLVLLAAPVLSAVASWIPAMLAVQQDPAAVLCQE